MSGHASDARAEGKSELRVKPERERKARVDVRGAPHSIIYSRKIPLGTHTIPHTHTQGFKAAAESAGTGPRPRPLRSTCVREQKANWCKTEKRPQKHAKTQNTIYRWTCSWCVIMCISNLFVPFFLFASVTSDSRGASSSPTEASCVFTVITAVTEHKSVWSVRLFCGR